MTERPLRRDGFIWELRRKLAMLDVLRERALDVNIAGANARLAEESEPMKKTSFDHYLEEQLKDPAFAGCFERAGEAWDVALQLAALRQ